MRVFAYICTLWWFFFVAIYIYLILIVVLSNDINKDIELTMYIKRKKWTEYTNDELAFMIETVANASADTPFSPEYAGAYLNKSPSTLQHMRCHKSDTVNLVGMSYTDGDL
jgi:hypothetical protein